MESRPPALGNGRISLRLGQPTDAEATAKYTRENADHLSRYSPERPPEEMTPDFWIQRFARDRSEFADDASCRLLLLAAPDDRVIGTVNLFSFSRAAFQACVLGYGLAESAQGKGLMTEALSLVIAYGFGELGFHRIEANVHPDNVRSRALMGRLGFVEEGLAQEYLLVRGTWVPHVFYALTNPHWPGAGLNL